MAERENVIDFTVPYYDLVGITIMMNRPAVSTSLFKFLTVLENDVWLCILAAYFFTRFLTPIESYRPSASKDLPKSFLYASWLEVDEWIWIRFVFNQSSCTQFELTKSLCFLYSILLWIFDRWSPYSYQNNKDKYLDDPEEEKREFSLKESLWFCMTSLTPQVCKSS